MIIKNSIFTKNFLIAILLCVPIIAFLSPTLLTGNNMIFGGDFDMQIQMTEAARISIQEYGQFPFWNPWVSGGVPLYADPQFGLITPQTVLSLLVGSIFAWKLTVLFYLIIGFLSMKHLLAFVNKTTANSTSIVLLSYIWIFGSFFTLRATGGHFTFLLLALAPLAIYLLLRINESKKYVILLSLLVAYCINAALHYSTLLIILILGFVALCITLLNVYRTIIVAKKHNKILPSIYLSSRMLGSLLIALIGAFALTSIRIYLSSEYLKDNSVDRTKTYESFIGLPEGLKSLFLPYGSYTSNPTMAFGQFEASNYIGIITGIILTLSVILILIKYKKSLNLRILLSNKRYDYPLVFTTLAIASFVIGLGGVIFYILRELPGMSFTRVSTRYFFITALALIVVLSILIHKLTLTKRSSKYITPLIYALLTLSTAQVFISDYKFQHDAWTQSPDLISLNTNYRPTNTPPHSDQNWTQQTQTPSFIYHGLTEATFSHHAQIIADNALVDTRNIPTQRCDEDSVGCSYILSNNAAVVQWTPNHIKIRRTAPGVIAINLNQSSHWVVNNEYLFKNQKTVYANSTFTIPDNDIKMYDIEYQPRPNILKS